MGRRQYKIPFYDYDNHLEEEKRILYMERSSITNSMQFVDDKGNHVLTVNMDLTINILDAINALVAVDKREEENVYFTNLVSEDVTQEEMLKIFKHE